MDLIQVDNRDAKISRLYLPDGTVQFFLKTNPHNFNHSLELICCGSMTCIECERIREVFVVYRFHTQCDVVMIPRLDYTYDPIQTPIFKKGRVPKKEEFVCFKCFTLAEKQKVLDTQEDSKPQDSSSKRGDTVNKLLLRLRESKSL